MCQQVQSKSTLGSSNLRCSVVKCAKHGAPTEWVPFCGLAGTSNGFWTGKSTSCHHLDGRCVCCQATGVLSSTCRHAFMCRMQLCMAFRRMYPLLCGLRRGSREKEPSHRAFRFPARSLSPFYSCRPPCSSYPIGENVCCAAIKHDGAYYSRTSSQLTTVNGFHVHSPLLCFLYVLFCREP